MAVGIGEGNFGGNEIERRAALVETACAPGGVINEIAQAALTERDESLEAHVVPDVLMPRKDVDKDTRFTLNENAKPAVKAAAEAHADKIFELAENLGMRRENSLAEAQLARINPDAAVFVAEDGANRTGAVRPHVLERAMTRIYGLSSVAQRVMYQIGSTRPIPREILDKKASQAAGKIVYKANPELKIAKEMAPKYLSEDDKLTSFDLSVAYARQDGFTVTFDSSKTTRDIQLPDEVTRIVQLYKFGRPIRILVQPSEKNEGMNKGLMSGLEAVAAVVGVRNGEEPFQFVIGTNGQYIPKDELQADMWAEAHEVTNMLPPVALGDEPGFVTPHNGKEIVTADRAPMTYVTEAAVLERFYHRRAQQG